MRKFMITVLGLLCVSVLLVAQAPPLPSDKVLMFRTMVGVSGPFVGATNPIRGVPGGGLPWVIADGRGELDAGGDLNVRVTGLVLAATGTNPLANFRALVSCLTVDGMGNPAIVNASTDNFPANPLGDARIRATVNLPSPCFAPIIFITTPGGSWLAITGR